MLFRKIINRYYQRVRIFIFRRLSNNTRITGSPHIHQPVLLTGVGSIRFGKDVMLGYFPSPFFYSGYIHLEARNEAATIIFGDNIFSNNNLCIICDKTSVEIGNNVLIGTNVEIIDSDFHELHPDRRNSGNHICRPVKISDNVFLGSNVRVMKGVTIGENSVVSNGSIVIRDIPANVIAAGNPAVVVKSITQ